MENKCQNCGSPNIKHVPAGFSKAKNKAYKAFSVCEDCKQYQNNTPKVAPAMFPPANSRIEALLEEILNIVTDIQNGRGNSTF